MKFDAEALGGRNMARFAPLRDGAFARTAGKKKTVQRDLRAALSVYAARGSYFTSTNSTGVPANAIFTMRYGAAVDTNIVTGAAPPDISTR